MREIIVALLFVLFLNVTLFTAQLAIIEIDPESSLNYFNYDGSYPQRYDENDYTLKDFELTDLPTTETSVSEEGNFFTDIFASIKNWLIDTIPGASTLLAIVNTVPNFLKAMGLPKEISYILGWCWHLLTVFIAIMWLKS